MSERGFVMKSHEVRGVLAGRQTQVRRVVKPQPFMVLSAADWHSRAMSGVDPYGCRPMGSHVLEEMEAQCPHGKPGERLWVRETWTPDHAAFYPNFLIVYRADRGYEYERNDRGEVYSPEQKAWYPYRWRPARHMRRSDSRITLEITGVRVERLHETSDKDAIAEGCPCPNYGIDDYWKKSGDPDTPADVFMELWQSINGPESWSANPWVWVIEFRRMLS